MTRVNLSLLAIAAIIAAALILGTPGDEPPKCISEFAIADACDPLHPRSYWCILVSTT